MANLHISGSLLLASLVTYLINLPFGYWRAGQRKLSFKWFLFIHLPVPLVIAIRYLFGLGFEWITYPFLVAAFFTGQATGALLLKQIRNKVGK